MKKGLCSIVILSYNQMHYTKQCLESIRTYTKDVPYEIIVVDNASNQETVDYLQEQKDITLICNKENKGFAGGCNQGIGASLGEYIMLLNNDTIVTHQWLFNMVKLLEEREDISMVGPLTNSTVGKQMIKVPYGDELDKMHEFARMVASSEQEPWRTIRLVAFCVLIRKTVLEEIGCFDENFQIGNYEDDDFNIRALLADKKLYICRNSFLHHFMNISFKKSSLPREQIMMRNKLLLESKWEHLDWNHHAVFNSYMLSDLLKEKKLNILHIGCGLGALEVELKDASMAYQVTGMEEHSIRRKIASEFVDKLLSSKEELLELISNKKSKFDVIILECAIEKYGLDLLDSLHDLLKSDGFFYLRCFNQLHISTLERAEYGEVEGDLLCATSKEFRYYFDYRLGNTLREKGYEILEEKEVVKSFSIRQEGLWKQITEETKKKEARIYNRIYKIRKYVENSTEK